MGYAMNTKRSNSSSARSRRHWLYRVLCTTAAVALLAGLAKADEAYPSRSIRIIVPFSAGGPSDTTARIAAKTLSTYLKQSVYVENRTGGGGSVGVDFAAAAPADGYTLVLSDAATFVVVPLSRKVDYDIEKDFVGIGQIASAAQALAVSPQSKFKTVKDLVEFARANPGKVSFGSAGIGTTTHLSIQLLKQDTSISLVHVPYRGTSLSVVDVLSQNIDAVFGDVTTLASYVDSGKLTALATTGDTRSPVLPNVPTMTELGYPGVRMVNWFGLHVSSKTPSDIQQKLKDAVLAMQSDPEFIHSLSDIRMSAGAAGSDAFNSMVRDFRERLGPVIKSLGPLD
jgi:tripartite-type tricarboxylate transporter receptor subunit TctC